MNKSFNILFSLFVLLISVYHFDFNWTNANTVSRVLFVKAVVEDGTLIVDKYHDETNDIAFINGHYYSEKAPLPAMLVTPIYYLFYKLGFTNINDHLVFMIGNFMVGSLPFALIILITFFSLQKLKPAPENVFLSTLPFLGSFVFIYSGTFFAHVLTSVFILAAYIFLKKRVNYFASGMLAAMAVLCEYAVLAIVMVWAVQIVVNTKKIKPLLQFIAGAFPFALFLMIYNYSITGNPFEFLNSHLPGFAATANNLGFAHLPNLYAVIQLLFGTYRGIFFFAPMLIFFVIIWFINKNFYPKHILTDYLVLPCLLYLLLISSYFEWYGGWCYGPRFLSVVAVLFLYQGIIKLNKVKYSKPLLYFFASIGIIFTFMAKATTLYSLPSEEHNPMFNLIIPEFFKGNWNNDNLLCKLMNIDAVTANLIWIPILLIPLLLFYNWGKRINNQRQF